MTRRSHAAARSLREADRDFPAHPILPAGIVCGGLAYIGRGAELPPELRELRENISGLRRGTIGDGADSRHLLLVTFLRPVRLDEAGPTALRLAATSAGTLTSFRREPAPLPAGRPGAEARTLALWWGGKPHRIAIDALEPLSLATLWDLPRLHLHHAVGPRNRSAPTDNAATAAPTTPVARARVPVEKGGSSVLRDMDEDLRAAAGRSTFAERARTLLDGIFRPRLLGNGGGGGRGGHWGTRPRGPGALSNLLGWLRWHTPLGEPLRRQFGNRMRQVEKLIAAGDMDAALRLALRLGAGKRQERQRSRYPNQVPGMRARLDFQVDDDTFLAPIFADNDFGHLQARYRALADQLEQGKDHRRAAYIYSQLLGDHARAVLALEKGKMLDEAIKLAIDSRQDAVLIVRLLYQAGRLDAALAFAKRTACFEQLAEDSRRRDPAYHAYVVEAWTEQLLDTGQAFRALQVTDHLAGIADLAAARRTWLAAALADEGPHGFDGELAVRTLLTAAWTEDDLSAEGLGDFPFMATVRGNAPFPAALDWLQAAIRGEPDNAREVMLGLLAALARLAANDRDDQAAFWRGPAGPVIEAFARGLVEQTSDRLEQADLRAVQALLEKAQLAVLAADVRKLKKLEAAKPNPSRERDVPAAGVVRPAVVRGCFLANGNMLIWRESRLLQLLDRHGAPLWQQNVSDVSALVAIGTSPNVIVVQAERDGVSRLTRFASNSRSFHPIGIVKLSAHHDITSESHWLVQIGGDIGGLDLAKLCVATPAIEFAWSCALTERLSAIAFGHLAGGPSWLTEDVSSDRAGIIESWSLLSSGELITGLCLPSGQGEADDLHPPTLWCWSSIHGGLSAVQGEARKWMHFLPWTDHSEERARLYGARRRRAGLAGMDGFQACDLDRPFVTGDAAATGGRIFVGSPDPRQPGMTLNGGPDLPLTCLARSSPGDPGTNPARGRPSGRAMLADKHGRLFIVNGREARLDIF